MKLYTKDMFLIAAEKCEVSMIDAEHIMKYIDEYVIPIELPILSKEKSEKAINLTAVEWLIEAIESQKITIVYSDKILSVSVPLAIAEQAKQMEKEQSITDYKHGQNNGYMYRDGNAELIQAEQYYNENYGK